MTGLTDISFCHLVVGVSDMDRALAFYRDALGMDVVFETLISGEPFDAVLHAKRKQEGRVVGGLLGGLMVELGSGTGTGGEPKWGGYAAAKAVIRGLSKIAALEWGRAFLLSSDATFVTGQTIHVDGGIGCFR